MDKNNQEISIPLLTFSTRPSQEFYDSERKCLNLYTSNCIRITPSDQIPKSSYAVKIFEDTMAPVLPSGVTGIFASAGEGPARENIYLIGIREKPPVIRKVVKNDISASDEINKKGKEEGLSTGIRGKRKSFMATTPLHIPDSQVSPIPGSTHRMIFFRDLKEPGKLKAVAAKDILWMHPLICVWQD